jgi:hypothetical protein
MRVLPSAEEATACQPVCGALESVQFWEKAAVAPQRAVTVIIANVFIFIGKKARSLLQHHHGPKKQEKCRFGCRTTIDAHQIMWLNHLVQSNTAQL